MQSEVSACAWGLQDVNEEDAKWELQRDFQSGAEGVVRGLLQRAE